MLAAERSRSGKQMIPAVEPSFALAVVESVVSCLPCRAILSATRTWSRRQAPETPWDPVLPGGYCPDEDDYDPRNPECILPAAAGEISRRSKELLDAQTARLEAFVVRRPLDGSRIAEHYRRVASELRAEAAGGLTPSCSATSLCSLEPAVQCCSLEDMCDTCDTSSCVRRVSSCSTCDTGLPLSPTRSRGTSPSFGDDEAVASAEEDAKLDVVVAVPAIARSKSEPVCFKPSRRVHSFSLRDVFEEEDPPRLRRGLPGQRLSIQAPRRPAAQGNRSLRIRRSLLDDRREGFVEGCALWLLENTFLGKAFGAASEAR